MMLAYVGILVCLLCSAFFSGSEIALTSVNMIRMKKAAEEGSKTAAAACRILSDFDRILSTILIGNNLVNIAASALATVIAMDLFPGEKGVGAALATLVMTVMILIFGEIVPKVLSKEHAEKVSRFCAIPLRILMGILSPVVYLTVGAVDLLSRLWGKESEENAPSVTEDELVSIIETAEEEDVIDEDKSDLLQSAIEFSDTTLAEILTPRTDMHLRRQRSQQLHTISERKMADFVESQLGKRRAVLWESSRHAGEMYGLTDNYIRVRQNYAPELSNTVTEVVLSKKNIVVGTPTD